MALSEKDRSGTFLETLLTNQKLPSSQEATFLAQLGQGNNRKLARPFNPPDWRLFLPTISLFLAGVVLYTHLINFGKLPLEWQIGFNVNLMAGLAVLLLGTVLIAPRLVKNPQSLRTQNTITSIGLLVLIALFLFSGAVNLGEFKYKLEALDISSVLGLLTSIGLVFMAFAGSGVAVGLVSSLFLWWGFSINGGNSDTNLFGVQTVVDLFTSENGGRLLRAMTPPNWNYFSKVIDPMLLTVQTAIAATVIGIVVALPLSVLAARNTTPHPVVYNIIRFVINMVRAVPSLILALIFIPFVGLGPSAGIMGLGLHSISVLTKLFAESFESVKPQPLEALNAVGANGTKSFRWGVFPQAFPLIASYSIFNWESNGRDSTVVAFVGGGGIGFLLQANLSLLDYANVAVMLIVLVITVSLLDRFSDFVRSRIL